MSEQKILESMGEKVLIKTLKEFDPKEYFKDKDNLFVWSDFSERISSKAPIVATEQEINVVSFKLLERATDEEIEKSLPEKHIFSESEVCAIVAGLIDKQPKGEDGLLENNGYANLFYIASFVVRVYWRGSRWYVHTWGRGGNRWLAERRVFSPATDL